MLKKSAVAAALFFITVSSNVHALGLGALDMHSALNQPMNAAIDLTSASGIDLSKIKVSIASQQAHDRTGLSRAQILTDFKFSVDRDSQGNAFIRVTSSDAIHEPFLEFLLELEWPHGRLLREYTVLVDPPVTMPARPAVTATPVSRAPAPVVQSPVRPPAPIQPQPVTSPVRTAAAPSADSYGPIRRNDTLWNIAKRVRPGNDISIDQMMHALLRENPHAFMNNNINQLKAGATLNIPDRNTIMSLAANEARAETNRQAREWQEGQEVAAQENAPQESVPEEAAETEVATESHLQLTAPEDEAIEGAATASSGDPEAAEGQSAAELGKQLALVSEEAEASKVQSEELQSRVTELEEQIETMKRLLELKDDALADMQQLGSETAVDAVTDAEVIEIDAPEDTATEMAEATAATEIDEQPVAEAVEDVVVESESAPEPRGIVNKLMDNPMLAGLGVLVALLLGGFLWASTRRKGHQSIFDEEMTLEKHMASEATMKGGQQVPVVDFDEDLSEEEIAPLEGHDDSDPVTEADVYLAYGRIQQAEEVLQAALEKTPDDEELRIKLLEVYHAGGNIAAFDREASNFRNSVTGEDSQWLRVAAMGYALSPENELYSKAGSDLEKSGDMDMDLSSMDDPVESNDSARDTGAEVIDFELPESIEFTLDNVNEVPEDEEDASEGMLNITDEVATKLDLARAYMDMGDPEGARGILDEVMGEGNDEQKLEAESIISELASAV